MRIKAKALSNWVRKWWPIAAIAVSALAILFLFEARDYFLARYFVQFVVFLGDLVKGLVAWPLVALVAVLLFAGSGAASNLFDRVKSLSGFGVSAEFSERGSKALRQNVRELVGDTEAFRRALNDEVSALVAVKGIEEKLRNCLMRDFAKKLSPEKLPRDFRCCIHVPDPLFKNRLYQLTDYAGDGDNGAGRTKPMSYGIIGRVWRSGESVIKGDLITIPALSARQHDDTVDPEIREIALQWGMTLDEAARVRKRPSYVAVLVQSKGRGVCILYGDSNERHAFVKPKPTPTAASQTDVQAEQRRQALREEDLIGAILTSAGKLEIGEAIDDLLEKLSALSPKVELEK